MIDSAAAGVSYTSFGFSKNKEPLFQAKEAEKARIEARLAVLEKKIDEKEASALDPVEKDQVEQLKERDAERSQHGAAAPDAGRRERWRAHPLLGRSFLWYLVWGWVAFLIPLLKLAAKVSKIRDTLDNEEQKIGADIVERALGYPLKLIAENAGVNGSVVMEKVQSVECASGIFDRRWQQAHLNVDTAGGNATGHRFALHWLARDTAQALQEEIVARAARARFSWS